LVWKQTTEENWSTAIAPKEFMIKYAVK